VKEISQIHYNYVEHDEEIAKEADDIVVDLSEISKKTKSRVSFV